MKEKKNFRFQSNLASELVPAKKKMKEHLEGEGVRVSLATMTRFDLA